jgi:hypothetical protein
MSEESELAWLILLQVLPDETKVLPGSVCVCTSSTGLRTC